jgi:hypothetical protein
MVVNDKEKLKKAIQEISNSMTRMDAERDLIKEIIKDAHEEHAIDKKVLRKMARAFHKQNFSEEVATQEEFETLYQEVF